MPKNKKNKKKISKNDASSNSEKSKDFKRVDNSKSKTKKKHSKFKTFLKVILILFLLLCVIGAGIIAAVFFGFFGDDFAITIDKLNVGSTNTIVLDKKENEIANLSIDEKRKTVKLDEMSEYLPKAYIAIEDKRFYEHHGIDIKRTTGAILGTLTGHSSYGGSTITMQLVKNITKEKDRTIMRKVKEWAKAVQIERMISKKQILELYLNILFVGGNQLHGVELGSIYYFNKSAKDLDLAESAYLAGINQSPNAYNPYETYSDIENEEERNQKIEKRNEAIKNRTLTVLSEMKKQGLINSDEEYNAAVEKVNNGLQFTQGDVGNEINYSYHTLATIEAVIKDVMNEKNISYDLAETYVKTSGLKIYSTEDSSIQKIVEEEFAKTKYQIPGRVVKNGKKVNEGHTQAGIVILDHTTGQVVAVGSELGDGKAIGLNRAVDSVRQTGSSMKPIADIAPGLEEKVITTSTIYDDVLTDFGGGWRPRNSGDSYRGLITIRDCIKISHNIPMVKVMMQLTPKKSIEYLKKMGVTTLDDEKDNQPTIAIGGLTKGISPLEMAGAYGSIANDGVYQTPIFYTKVEDASGNVILTPKQEKTRVISEQNAYLTRSIIEEPLKAGGTAPYCSIKGMETCAKTGSTDDYNDRWLCGMTPYYTAACWWGFDKPETLTYANGVTYSVDGRNPAGDLWQAIMKDVHKDLANKNFNKPSGIITETICRATGCIATSTCTDTYTDIYTKDNIPSVCEGHGKQTICNESKKLATEYCPKDQVTEQIYGGVIPKETLGLWKIVGTPSRAGNEKVEETCTIHTKEWKAKQDKDNAGKVQPTSKVTINKDGTVTITITSSNEIKTKASGWTPSDKLSKTLTNNTYKQTNKEISVPSVTVEDSYGNSFTVNIEKIPAKKQTPEKDTNNTINTSGKNETTDNNKSDVVKK